LWKKEPKLNFRKDSKKLSNRNTTFNVKENYNPFNLAKQREREREIERKRERETETERQTEEERQRERKRETERERERENIPISKRQRINDTSIIEMLALIITLQSSALAKGGQEFLTHDIAVTKL